MTTGQTISIISAVIVSAIMISFSIISNQPKNIVPSGDQGTVENGRATNTTSNNKKWSLKNIIESVTKA